RTGESRAANRSRAQPGCPGSSMERGRACQRNHGAGQPSVLQRAHRPHRAGRWSWSAGAGAPDLHQWRYALWSQVHAPPNRRAGREFHCQQQRRERAGGPGPGSGPSQMMSPGNRIRILIVDDHEVVREGLKVLLEPERDFEVVAETGLGSEVPELVIRTRPDVVLLDARLPDISGPEICRSLSESHPEARVIILTSYTEDDLVEACIRAGAKGYLVK